MSLFLGDIRIKTMIELGLEDISKNPWLLNDVLGDTVANQYLRERYGKQIESCKQWLKNNRINITLSEQQGDKMDFPAISIEIGASNEKLEMKHMGDLSTQKIRLIPNEINKPMPYVIKPASGSYNPISGAWTFTDTISILGVSPGMVLVDPVNSIGYVIQSITQDNQVNLEKNLVIPASNLGVIPEYQFYEARIGHAFMQEPYKISCHGNDQQTLLWLHSIVVYSLLRYRQVLLEKDGYAESVISSGKMYPNPDYSDAGQVIWSRDVNITGQVENRWIMQPHRIMENFQFEPGGIKIISNITDTFENLNNVTWSTLKDIADEGDAEFE